MELPILEPAPVVTAHAGVFRDLFENQCQFRHVQHDLTGLMVLPNKSMANIARCLLDSADKTNLSRFFSEAPLGVQADVVLVGRTHRVPLNLPHYPLLAPFPKVEYSGLAENFWGVSSWAATLWLSPSRECMHMKVKTKFFAAIKDIVGTPEVDLELPDGITAGELFQSYCQQHTTLFRYANNTMISVNLEFVPPETRLHEGDEIAFIPPVSGGR